jgi:hypothetical protein
MTNRADRKARIAASRATARRNPEPMLVDGPTGAIAGFQFWKIGDVLVGMPALLPGAPASIRRRHRARIVANATGECTHCGTIANDPTGTVGYAGFPHRNGCPLLLTDIERWIDPRAQSLRGALASGEWGAA